MTSTPPQNSAQLQAETLGTSNLQFDKAASMAQAFPEELAALRKRLQDMGVPLSSDRFGSSNTELMRFAYTLGLCDAQTQLQRYCIC